jgi:hypothetical protein
LILRKHFKQTLNPRDTFESALHDNADIPMQSSLSLLTAAISGDEIINGGAARLNK